MAEVSVYFGDTGARKTTAMGYAAEYLYERNGGKILRGIYSDGGGYKVIKDRVDAGFIEPYNIQDEPDMPALLHKLARGYWPAVLENGIRPKGTKLLSPTAETWKKVGGYIYEGLTFSAESLMKYLRNKQISIGGDPVGKFEIAKTSEFYNEGDAPMLYCANNMKHYDWVQGEMMTVISEFGGLPVSNVLMTAHEAAGTDEDSRDPIRGPALVGKAAVGRVPRAVGDCIHFEMYNKPGADKSTSDVAVRAYYQAHPDPKFPNVLYKCKTRLPDYLQVELLKAFPGGYFEPAKIGDFMRTVDELIVKGGGEAARRKAEIDARLAGLRKAA